VCRGDRYRDRAPRAAVEEGLDVVRPPLLRPAVEDLDDVAAEGSVQTRPVALLVLGFVELRRQGAGVGGGRGLLVADERDGCCRVVRQHPLEQVDDLLQDRLRVLPGEQQAVELVQSGAS
jgi:hypothetical protein